MLPESARREAPFTIRRLIYADLPHVIAIERRSFPTPWSLAMFVLELSKASGICLAALDGDDLRQVRVGQAADRGSGGRGGHRRGTASGSRR